MIGNDGKRIDRVLDRLRTASFKDARRAYALLLLLHGCTVPLGLSISQELMEPCVYGVPCRRSMGGAFSFGRANLITGSCASSPCRSNERTVP